MDEEMELEVAELGEAKVETKGPFGVHFEDSPALPNRDLP